jgi:hypothetical protein
MLRIALAKPVPVVFIVREEGGEEELKNFGAENVLV